MDGRFLLNAARLTYSGARPDVPGDHVDTLYHYPVGLGILPIDPSRFAFVFAGYNQNAVPAADAHYTTSGAREMIRMKPLSRNSRATGPKMRVPRGNWFS